MPKGSKSFASEPELVAWLKQRARLHGRDVSAGIGDDAAVLRLGGAHRLLATTDLSIEGVHFSAQFHPPHSVGYRALARALSDIAAMGGTPRFALVSLALSRNQGRSWVEGFYRGFMALARRFGVSLIGGDTAIVSGATTVDVVGLGAVKAPDVLLRSGAKPGDKIFVSGELGLSATGLEALKHAAGREGGRGEPGERVIRRALRAHLYPEPRCALGRFLAERRLASAAIDLSDGLSSDLHRLCHSSGVGATLLAERIPAPAPPSARKFKITDRLDLALNGGEDYELLFTVPAGKADKIPRHFKNVPLSWIGEIGSKRSLRLINADGKELPLIPKGFDHFRTAR